MSYLLPHLHSGYAVDQAILSVRRPASTSAAPQQARAARARMPPLSRQV